MPADRLKVREGADGYEVLQDGEPIGFSPPYRGCKVRSGRGARVWLDWGRTIISRQTAPHDFAPTFLGCDSVGRLLGEQNGPSAGTWSWSISTHDNRWRKHGGQSGREPTEGEAVAALEVSSLDIWPTRRQTVIIRAGERRVIECEPKARRFRMSGTLWCVSFN
ncbi:hypothetical protein [Mesorhizobium sp. dw_380]|uniref:hypothetical protein n=1 Tax=Mesorhizobium sp. dw_380 TaxID=2812001 RepID=UPI001BDDD2F7|nr:hypothetical protein [Mesorhizobium sp. dw_380]